MTANFVYALSASALLGAPTLGALGYHAMTGDPSARPLSQTVEKLRTYTGGYREGIQVTLLVGTNAKLRETADDMARSLHRAFRAKGVDAHVTIKPVANSTRVRVAFQAGASKFKPVSYAAAPRSIRSVVEAYRISR
ncbi:hypothetical protein [Aliiroseovarius marinus]|uniref:hypothetical protein n=1 Tax=Aliiroseovarius marinus TaxID=2500159 RepID=UPI003D7C7FFA